MSKGIRKKAARLDSAKHPGDQCEFNFVGRFHCAMKLTSLIVARRRRWIMGI